MQLACHAATDRRLLCVQPRARLRLGLTVIADAANYLDAGRRIWLAAADAASVSWRALEVICSDAEEHQGRLSIRQRGLEPYPEPNWDAVLRRREETEPWGGQRLIVDSVAPLDTNVAKALEYLES